MYKKKITTSIHIFLIMFYKVGETFNKIISSLLVIFKVIMIVFNSYACVPPCFIFMSSDIQKFYLIKFIFKNKPKHVTTMHRVHDILPTIK